MPTDLIVNNNIFAYPDDGDPPGWGADATGWAVEVTDVLQTLAGTNDITETIFTLTNNTSSPSNITALSFNPSTVRSATVEYSIYILTSSTERAEAGTLKLVYKNGGPIGAKWSIGNVFFGDDCGIVFSVTDAGQVQYTSTNIAGTGYSGVIHFTATVTLQ